MEEIINKKLEILSFTTINAIREIHGLEPEVMSDSEKQTLIFRIIGIFYFVKSSLIDAFQIAVSKTSDLLESLKEEPEINGVEGRKSLELIQKIYESSDLGKEKKI